MSVAQSTSPLAAFPHLPSYTTAARQSSPPTYEQHVESLTQPERAFIADQTRLLGSSQNQNSESKKAAANVPDPDIERLQRLVDEAERRNRPNLNPQRAPTAHGWRIFITIVVLFALPAVFAALAAIATSFPYSKRCSGRRQAKIKGTAIYFGIAVGWLIVWTLLRAWKHKSRHRPQGPGAKFSVFWTFFIWIGYCAVVAYIWVKNVCMWL